MKKNKKRQEMLQIGIGIILLYSSVVLLSQPIVSEGMTSDALIQVYYLDEAPNNKEEETKEDKLLPQLGTNEHKRSAYVGAVMLLGLLIRYDYQRKRFRPINNDGDE